MMMHYTHVAFSSSGTQGLLYEGVIEALEDHVPEYEAWAAALRGVAGTSGGAVAALMLALQVPRARRRELVYWAGDVRNWVTPDVGSLVRNYGVDDGRDLRAFVQEILVSGGLSAATTMADLRRLVRVDVVFVAHDLLEALPVHLSAATAPDMHVADAVVASCAIPLVFTPVAYRGMQLVDGMLTEHAPAVFDDKETLHVVVPFRPAPTDLKGWFEYVNALMRASRRPQEARVAALLDKSTTIRVAHPLSQPSNPLQAYDDDGVNLQLRCGYAVALGWWYRTLNASLFHFVVRYMECISPVSACPDSEDESEPCPGSG